MLSQPVNAGDWSDISGSGIEDPLSPFNRSLYLNCCKNVFGSHKNINYYGSVIAVIKPSHTVSVMACKGRCSEWQPKRTDNNAMLISTPADNNCTSLCEYFVIGVDDYFAF